MSENTKLWDMLGRTDPAHVKKFKRAGGFEGTAIKPMWSYRRLTEEFGPCGYGWGVGEPSFQVVPGDNREVLVFCTVSAWYVCDGEKRFVHGVGGDKIVTHIKANDKYKTPERWQNDDEAFKKSFTDAVTNAFKLIGVGADVHMGLFDDNKYVNDMRQEFADPPPDPPAKSSAQLKREGAWEKMMFELSAAIGDCKSLVSLSRLKAELRDRARNDGWNSAFKLALKDELDAHEDRLKRSDEAAFDAETEAAAVDQRMRDERAAKQSTTAKMMDNFDRGEAALRDERAALANHPLNAG
jgi:hypothetical protein